MPSPLAYAGLLQHLCHHKGKCIVTGDNVFCDETMKHIDAGKAQVGCG